MDSISIAKELKEKEDKIASLKEKKARLEGRKSQLLKDLQTKFGISTVGEAKNLLDEKQTKIDNLENSINTAIAQIDKVIADA